MNVIINVFSLFMRFNRIQMMVRMIGVGALRSKPVMVVLKLIGIRMDDNCNQTIKEAKEIVKLEIDNALEHLQGNKEVKDISGIVSKVIEIVDNDVLDHVQKYVGNIQTYIEYEIDKKFKKMKRGNV